MYTNWSLDGIETGHVVIRAIGIPLQCLEKLAQEFHVDVELNAVCAKRPSADK